MKGWQGMEGRWQQRLIPGQEGGREWGREDVDKRSVHVHVITTCLLVVYSLCVLHAVYVTVSISSPHFFISLTLSRSINLRQLHKLFCFPSFESHYEALHVVCTIHSFCLHNYLLLFAIVVYFIHYFVNSHPCRNNRTPILRSGNTLSIPTSDI